MRRLFGWMAGLVSIAALARVLARRRRHEAPQVEPPVVQDPADELRQKLSQTREAPAEAPAEAPTEAPAPPEPDETLDERRSRVHAKAQEAIEAMQDAPE